MSGSIADHEALRLALEVYERAERIAGLVQSTFCDELADDAYLALTRLSILCGHDLGSPSATALDFATRRVRAFNNMTGKAV